MISVKEQFSLFLKWFRVPLISLVIKNIALGARSLASVAKSKFPKSAMRAAIRTSD
jgi:hypothetical protein